MNLQESFQKLRCIVMGDCQMTETTSHHIGIGRADLYLLYLFVSAGSKETWYSTGFSKRTKMILCFQALHCAAVSRGLDFDISPDFCSVFGLTGVSQRCILAGAGITGLFIGLCSERHHGEKLCWQDSLLALSKGLLKLGTGGDSGAQRTCPALNLRDNRFKTAGMEKDVFLPMAFIHQSPLNQLQPHKRVT